MSIHSPSTSIPQTNPQTRVVRSHLVAIFALWLIVFGMALSAPPLLDDADATHAQAARAILSTGDWVTLHVNGIRYLEKAPLPYWLVAMSFRCFGFNAFAAHLPGALAVLALALLGYIWALRTFGAGAALYTAMATLTAAGIFLFTRVFIPDVELSLFLAMALYAFDRCTHSNRIFPYLLWTSLALAVLAKGLIALVLFFATAAIYLAVTRTFREWRIYRPATGTALFLLIAAPWHMLASLRNTGGEHGHGFAWFYFINEHVLRFLNRRTPHDYNKLPAASYWSLHIVWLFPWSLFLPLAFVLAHRAWKQRSAMSDAVRTALLLGIFSATVLVFFALSTNQEYYTFPAYLPLLLLTAAALASAERTYATDRTLRRTLLTGHVLFMLLGCSIAAILAIALVRSRSYARPADIGSLLAHRAVSNYTFSMASFFDLTGQSFAALRLPAVLAMIAFAIGPAAALVLRKQRRHVAATLTVGLTSAVFLVAAHIALVRFEPMLSSKDFADKIAALANAHQIELNTDILLFGDQAYGSSIPFYLDRRVKLVDGRTTSMYFGSTFADAPPIFLTPQQLVTTWGKGERKVLFIPAQRHSDALALLGPNQIVLAESSGKLLLTDRPLASTLTPQPRSKTIN